MSDQKGSGLGLSISLSIMKKHGGHISVESQEGTGSTFHVFFPALRETPVAEKAQEVQLKDLSQKRLLFMDDDERIRILMTAMMDLLGYAVACAKDGEEAIALYRQAMESGKTFSAVILDLTIPGVWEEMRCEETA